MSLPREWSFVQQGLATNGTRVEQKSDGNIGDFPTLSVSIPADEVVVPMDMMSSSLLSVQSAPALEASAPAARPQHLPITTHKPCYLQSPPDTNLEEDDNLLTISSLTARPLIARSKSLRKGPNDSPSQEEAPDGGFGWFVVLGAFLVQFWVAGLVKSYGVLYVEVLETFPGSSATMASWVPAILSALCLALAPVSSALCQRFSCRSVVFIGGLFCTAGMAFSYWATSLLHLLFTFGVLTGIGGGLSTTPGIIIVSQYFEKHRALANGICVSGTAAGSFVFPMIIEHLVDRYGFHGTILLLGGGMLHVCVSAALYRPAPLLISIEEPRQRTPGPPSHCSTATTDTTLLSFSNPDCRNVMDPNDGMKVNNRLERLFLNDRLSDMDIFLNQKNALLNAENDAKVNSIHAHKMAAADNKMATAENKMAGSELSLKVPASPRSNLISDLFHPSLIEVTKPPAALNCESDESEEESQDVLGEGAAHSHCRWTGLRATRSSGRLHSVEDLSTDSTCVYKARHRSKPISRSMYIRPPAQQAIASLHKMAASANNMADLDKMERQDGDAKVAPDDVKVTCYDRIARYLDVSLLKDGNFMLVSGSVALMSTGSPYLLYYLPAHTLAIGHSKAEAGSLVAISAAMDLCGRLALGWLCDLQIFDRKKAYLLSVFVAGMSVLSLPLVTSWWLMAIASGCYGLCLGCWFLLVPVLLTDLFGRERISSSYGLVRMFQSVGAISVPPLAGYMRDVTGGYSLCFYGMGSCMVLGALPMLAVVGQQKKAGLHYAKKSRRNFTKK